MEVRTLTLQQYRSYKKEIFYFSPSVTLILGPNAVGKTNILEGIQTLSVGRSFRADREVDMIRWGEEVGRIIAVVNHLKPLYERDKNQETKLEIVLTGGVVNGEKAPTKKYLVNGVSRRQIDFVGNIYSVLFSPGDLELVTDSPSLRRQYINAVLVQTDREYRRNLLSYERGLRQRNKLLDLINEGKAGRSQLLFWNQLLIKSGSYLTEARQKFIEFINNTVSDNFHYRVVYDKSIISQSRLDQYTYEEVSAKTTLVGPQRDDIVFEKKEHNDEWRDIKRFGSRGEQRLAILWLKLAELSYIETQTEERPILLLDDIFSELDEESKAIVFSVVDKQQTIITSAEDEIRELFKKAKNLEVIKLPDEKSDKSDKYYKSDK